MAAMPMLQMDVQNLGLDLAQKTVCVKVRLGRTGDTRKVSKSQVEVDTDKTLIRVSKDRRLNERSLSGDIVMELHPAKFTST